MELMIVIVIIGVVYTLAVTKLKSVGEEKMMPSLANLKEYLDTYMEEGATTVRLLCLDDCSECSIYMDGTKVKTIESFFDESVEVYRYDTLQGLVERQKPVFFNEEDVQESVCFSFKSYKNRVSEQIIVAYKERAYDYSSYFEGTQVYDSLDDLVEDKERRVQEVMQ